MAKVYGIASQMRGKMKNIIYKQTKYGTVAYEAPVKPKVPRRSEKQMETRMSWVNIAAVYRQFYGTLNEGFENRGVLSNYNCFISANTGICKVYITKRIRQNGGSVLAPYQVTRGSLPSIEMTKNDDDVLVTDIALGLLVIIATTTVAEFTVAVIACNDSFAVGDQITFFYGVQTVDATTGVPRAKISGSKVVLDPNDETPLWDIVGELGFTSLPLTADGLQGGYVLGMSQVITDGAAVWVHSRENSSGLKVGTQFMYVDNSVLASYQGDDAFVASCDSYGGINSASVYLQPTELGNQGNSSTGTPSTPSGGSGTQNQGGGSETPSGGGQQTVTVEAPTFSGATQFTDTTQVTMSGPAGSSIFYTLDGSTPTDQSLEYEEPITLSATTTVKAIAIKDGVSSSVTTRVYTKGSGGGGGGDGEE